jgi:Uncharacterised protein family UPF0547
VAFLDHEGGAEFPYKRDQVFDALLQAIPTVSGMKVDKHDRSSGIIAAKAGVSLMSWGERIPISVAETAPGRTRVSITSTPKTGVLMGGAFDLGKNRRNIEKVLFATAGVLGRLPKASQEPASDDPTPASTEDAETKTCPQCAETVKAQAKICRFCRHDFEQDQARATCLEPSRRLLGLGRQGGLRCGDRPRHSSYAER